MFIVLEGLDGAGKSTQMRALESYCMSRSKAVRFIHFPRFDAPVYGDLIARFLRGDLGRNREVNPYVVALLFAGDRADASAMIRQWLAEGYVVVADRYVYSNIAYQGAKLGTPEERAALKEWISEAEYRHFAIPKPDINLFLDVPLSFVRQQLAAMRGGSDRDYLKGKQDIHEQDIYFQARVREMYLELCRQDQCFHRIDCAGPNGEMADPSLIFDRIQSVLKSHEIS